MEVNRVDVGDQTLLDLTSDTVTPETLLEGVTAHNAAGELITGTLKIPTKTSDLINDSGFITTSAIPSTLPANGGNADTVDGIHIIANNDAVTGSWFAAFTMNNEIRAIDPTRAYVGNADTVDMYHASDFIGQGFSYKLAEEIYDVNDLLNDAHFFLFNKNNTPTSYGFIDVKRFNGEGFAPSPISSGGIVLQTWHDWNDPSLVFYRVRRQNTWTDWSLPKTRDQASLLSETVTNTEMNAFKEKENDRIKTETEVISGEGVTEIE